MISITLNGEKLTSFDNNLYNILLAQKIDFDDKWIVIVLNDEIVNKQDVKNIIINNNDNIEIVKPFSGG